MEPQKKLYHAVYNSEQNIQGLFNKKMIADLRNTFELTAKMSYFDIEVKEIWLNGNKLNIKFTQKNGSNQVTKELKEFLSVYSVTNDILLKKNNNSIERLFNIEKIWKNYSVFVTD